MSLLTTTSMKWENINEFLRQHSSQDYALRELRQVVKDDAAGKSMRISIILASIMLIGALLTVSLMYPKSMYFTTILAVVEVGGIALVLLAYTTHRLYVISQTQKQIELDRKTPGCPFLASLIQQSIKRAQARSITRTHSSPLCRRLIIKYVEQSRPKKSDEQIERIKAARKKFIEDAQSYLLHRVNERED